MLTLSALYKHCVFQSQERLETHTLVARELSDHHLRWQGGAIDTRLYKFEAPRLALYSLRYGDEVEIYPQVYEGFSLVHFALRGGIEVQADGGARALRQGRALVSSPRRNIRLRWSQACEQLILRVPHTLLHEAAGQLGRTPREGGWDNPGLTLSPASSLQWQLQLQTFMALENYTRQSEAYSPWLAHLEQSMAMFLLLQGTEAAAASEATQGQGSAGRLRRRLDRLQDFALANLTQPVTLADLAAAVALSERQLNALCQEHLNASPMVWLRGLRLDSVRESLLAQPEADIAGVAMLHGFAHLGRFAGYYRSRFGELPSETLRSAKSG